MNVIMRAALRQTRIELRNQLMGWTALSWVFFPLLTLVVLLFLRNTEVMGSDVSLAQLGIPGLLTMNLISAAMMGLAGQMVVEREDGTLLRAKTIPRGMQAHLLGTVLTGILLTLIPTWFMLGVAGLLVDGVTPRTAGGWVLLVSVSVLGLLAVMPWGAVLGSILASPVLLWIVSLVVYGALAISGVFYPISALPGWLQPIGQSLPTYWTGLGLRQALLPAAAVALEVGESWRTGTVFIALVVWGAVGFALAPPAIARMARRQSGSMVAAARDRTLVRGY